MGRVLYVASSMGITPQQIPMLVREKNRKLEVKKLTK